jgi:L,D-transpeptidase ErfK/SrfK
MKIITVPKKSLLSICIALLLVSGNRSERSAIPVKPVQQLKINTNNRYSKEITNLKKRIGLLKKQYDKFKPGKPYLIVNTSDNEFSLMDGNRILRKNRCSTGSYILLKAENYREWLFKTPRGKFRVTVKLADPWWFKPDWHYIEEGLPIPSPYDPKRYQPNVLGDYAVGFGHGYLIHGTIYKRFLGMPVTHGCVRLGDDDMKVVFSTLKGGSHVYVY